jgi:hypothetical protein
LPQVCRCRQHPFSRKTARGIVAVPLMVTIDPERDSIATIRAPLTAHQAVFRGGSGGVVS